MNGQTTTQDHAAWTTALLAWLRERLTACGRGVLLGALALAEALVAPLAALPVAAPIPGVGLQVRRLAELTRRLSGEWCGVPIPSPYLPPPGADASDGGDGAKLSWRQRWKWMAADPATWRDLLWMIVNPCAGAALAGGSAAAVVYGVFGMALPHGSTQLAGSISHPLYGILLAASGFWAAPWMLRGYGEFARSLLGPTRQAELAQRVRSLAQSRADTIDTGAAEMRRIERDLHDGAQARLVAMGMTLDAAGQLLDTSPAGARALLAEARDSSLNRGLADAVRALALDSPLPVAVTGELPARPPAPVESAAYFAVSELLANVSKHAGADRVWIDIRYSGGTNGGGMLRIGVTDDGSGGADPAGGTGLRGIERRLAAFDGVLAVSSPPGGPTVMNMEMPCALSSPKTSSS